MKPQTRIQLLQASFAALLTFTLLIHTLLSGTPFSHLLHLLSNNPILSLSCAWCFLISLLFFFSTRPRPVLLLNYSCFKPDFDRKCSYEVCEYFVRRTRRFTPVSENFMRGIYLKSGLGDETYAPPFIFQTHDEAKLESAFQEAREGMFSAVDSLLTKTKIDPSHIDVLIVTCGSFSPSPSLSSLLVNHYKLRPDIKTYNLSGMGCSSGVISIDSAAKLLRSNRRIRYALVVVTENISLNWYFGDDRSMLVTNCIFRVGCAAAILTNDPSHRRVAKMELVNSLRTHHGADDRSYRAAFQEEDESGNTGVSLTKDLIRVAGVSLREHIKLLAPRVLPLSQLVSYAYSMVMSVLSRGDSKPAVPDFMTAFEHVCIHTGGKAVIEQVGRVLRLGDEVTEPARMSLHRFGNTSSSLVFYELAYFEAKRRVKKGDRMWMLAFGTGFKVCSLVWKSLQDSGSELDNPWNDRIHRYPLKACPQLVPLNSSTEQAALLDLRSSLGLRGKDWPRKADPCSVQEKMDTYENNTKKRKLLICAAGLVIMAAVHTISKKILCPCYAIREPRRSIDEDPTDLLEDERCDDEEDLESNDAIVMEDISGLDTNDAWTTKRDELAIQMMSQKTTQSKESKDKSKNANWNSPMEMVCIKTLTNEYNKGNKGDNGWKPQAYQAVVNAIYEKLGISLNKEQVRSRIKRWKKEYLAISTLLDQSGFGWDDTKKMVTADDSVWDEYLKSHSDARPYMTKSIPDFDSLSLIIANDSANGSGMLSGFDAEHTTNQDDTFSRGTNIEDMRTGLEDLHEWDNPIRNEVPATSAPLGASLSWLNNEARKKKKTRREGSSDESSTMNANLRFIAEAINNTTAEVDIEPLMIELEKIPELDEDLVIEAAEYLSSDKKKGELVLRDE
ncbi:hypothetical protein HHK36_004141 [Tetracentron sinense]|uniref:very-long-chain 3-oxoacyl-CoA synthase n=1 Tax=Tetracentron sinense TaxID=13715 RepID=A0A834ZTR6_TETSI|nr:hypothetical protein HHK36_004141 [Tetracentron sinense]